MERQELAAEVDNTGIAVVNELSIFTEQQLNRVPFEGSWTGGQVAEHLLKASGVVDVVFGNVAETNRPPDANIGMLRVFLDFTIKMQSPDFIIPSDDYHHKQQVIGDMQKALARIGEATRTLELDKTCLDFEMPGVGRLTRLEWITFHVFHSKRHLHQLENIYARLKEGAPA